MGSGSDCPHIFPVAITCEGRHTLASVIASLGQHPPASIPRPASSGPRPVSNQESCSFKKICFFAKAADVLLVFPTGVLKMRHSVAGVLTLLSLTPLMIGCQQTSLTGQSSLTPVSSAGTLSPVRTTSGVGPLGGPVRVPPPPTGGFAVPNNYMGGGTASAQIGSSVSNGYATTASAGFASNQPIGSQLAASANRQSANVQGSTGGVQPSGWVQSGSSIGGQPSFSAPLPNQPLQANIQRPQSGGMRVIDLTGSAPPPGYRPTQFGPNTNQFAGGTVTYNGPLAPSVSAQNQYQPQVNSQVGFQSRGQAFGSSVVTAVPQNSFRPATQPAASIAAAPSVSTTSNSLPRINPILSSPVQTREFPMQASPLAPSWKGVSNFDNKPPSTEPVGNDFGQTDDDLPWRRPDLQ